MRKTSCRLTIRLIWILLLTACSTYRYQTDPAVTALLDQKPVYPQTRFAVFSDIHFYDARLGTSGKAFADTLKRDRKMLPESPEILQSVMDAVVREKPDFLLVCGDLTKDGEEINHRSVQARLRSLEQQGVAVYVIPGNHDVANGRAVRFEGSRRIPVSSVSAEGFAEIYADFGYQEALYRDSHSLSYVAEPVPGLWLLALDSCKWRENKPGEKSDAHGAFFKPTRVWIEEMLIRSRRKNKAVIAMMHHGLLEHYTGNADYFPWYVVDDHQAVSAMLGAYGVSLVLTGHFHAQDIIRRQMDDNQRFLFDIETGSLVTAPCPYRIVNITADRKASIQTRRVLSIPSHPDDFPEFANRFLKRSMLQIIDRKLDRYGVAAEDRRKIAPLVVDAYTTHLYGDEKAPVPEIHTGELGIWAAIVVWMRRDMITSWYRDLPPADNFLEIDLTTGQYHEPNQTNR